MHVYNQTVDEIRGWLEKPAAEFLQAAIARAQQRADVDHATRLRAEWKRAEYVKQGEAQLSLQACAQLKPASQWVAKAKSGKNIPPKTELMERMLLWQTWPIHAALTIGL